MTRIEKVEKQIYKAFERAKRERLAKEAKK